MLYKSKKTQIFFFSLLSLPLSFVGIPIYLNISDFYARKFELGLTLIGFLLIFVRAVDAIQDPFIGYVSDSLSRKKISHKKIVTIFSLLLCVAFYLVFNPPSYLSQNLAILWFLTTLTLTYTCFNFVVINFESLAAIFAKNDQERIALNSTKELLGLVGMILAFILPTAFVSFFSLDSQKIYLFLSLSFAALICAAILALNKKTNSPENIPSNFSASKVNFFDVLKDKKFLTVLGIFFINSLAVSLPAANLNFYVRNILFAEDKIGWFLSIYFISACLFIPLWKFLASRFGIVKIWIFSIAGSVLTFSFAYFLNQDSANYFYLVCFLSGVFLGPDLIMPPTILAKITYDKKEIISSYFSIWNMINKLGLMVAASSSLIILGFAGYNPKEIVSQGAELLPFFYAALPCLLKILVIIFLLKQKFLEKTYET
jgi:glycoside/pentoside/hexuronide:cation symporter, GPH family